MILLVCVDDRLGMAFNRRRQSMDRLLRKRILSVCCGKRLFMSPYSAKQFLKDDMTDAEAASIYALPDYLEQAGPGDYCFLETDDVLPLEDDIETIYLYCWNRRYPADLYFSVPLAGHGWKLTERAELPGSSHEMITEEIYRR